MAEDQWNRLPPTALNIKSNTSTFIARWAASGAAERANAQSFITELCALLSLEPTQPKTPDESDNAYVFEKTIPSTSGNKNFIDCYKRGHFVLESKQGADADTREAALSLSGEQQRAQRKTGHGQRGSKAWDTAMDKARAQAEKYVRSLPRQELTDGGRPPFIMVVDVATASHCTPTGAAPAGIMCLSLIRLLTASRSPTCNWNPSRSACKLWGPTRSASTRVGAAQK